jgi:glycosyltransferase involved in cell wall biosynthesis
MIVRDAERDLPLCIESVRGALDEIVIADTGSTDNTIEIARKLGARVISVPWENDFARARNLSLAEVTADWVLSMDADERLDPAAARRLPALLANRKARAYQVPIRNYVISLNEFGTAPQNQIFLPFPRPKNIQRMSIMKMCASSAILPSCILWAAFTKPWASASSKLVAGWDGPTL